MQALTYGWTDYPQAYRNSLPACHHGSWSPVILFLLLVVLAALVWPTPEISSGNQQTNI